MERGCGECRRGTRGLDSPFGKRTVGGFHRRGDRTAGGSLRGKHRSSLGGPGLRDPESFLPSLFLPAHRKLNPPLPPPQPPFPPLCLPTPLLAQKLLAALLLAAGAGEAAGGESRCAWLASRGWPARGSGSPVRPGSEALHFGHTVLGAALGDVSGAELQLPSSGRTPPVRAGGGGGVGGLCEHCRLQSVSPVPLPPLPPPVG